MALPILGPIIIVAAAVESFNKIGRGGEIRDRAGKGPRKRPKQNPPIGSVVYRRLGLLALAEHSGVHLGRGRFASKKNNGYVEIEKLDDFLGDQNSLFVSAKETRQVGDDALPRPRGRFIIAVRARMQAWKRRNYNDRDVYEDGSYSLFFNNCHAFTGYCVTGEKVDVTGLSELKPIVKKATKISKWVEWRYEA